MAKAKINHWLMVRLGHLGDVLLTTGVLRHFGQTQGLVFDVLTRSQWAEVFTNHPHVNSVHVATAENLASGGILPFTRQVAGSTPAGCGLLDLHGVLRTRIMRLVWSGEVAAYPKMGVARRFFQASHGRYCGEALREISVPQRYALALDASITPESYLLPQLWLDARELEEGEQLLRGAGFAGTTRPVALHPFATHASKAWPAKHWERLAALMESQGIPWIWVGKRGGGPKGSAGQPVLSGPSLVDACTLRQSAAVLARCRSLITGDSGPMHLARAVGTPVVAIFGPTTREWGFYPTPAEGKVLERPMPCRPCSLHGQKTCPHEHRCLAEITPEEVLSELP